MKPPMRRSKRYREQARRERERQWRFMERVAEHGTLWFCNWNKNHMPQLADEDRYCLMSGLTITSWTNAHPDWFVFGDWDAKRYAFPVQLTDAGRAALADRGRWDMEPVEGGLVEPGWRAVPTAGAA